MSERLKLEIRTRAIFDLTRGGTFHNSVTLGQAQSMCLNDLSVRAMKALRCLGFSNENTLHSIVYDSRMSIRNLLLIPHCGVTSVREIERFFGFYGFKLEVGEGGLPYPYHVATGTI